MIFTGDVATTRQRFAEGYDSVTMGMDTLFFAEMYKKMADEVWRE